MSKLTVTNFTKRTGSPFQSKDNDVPKAVVQTEVIEKTQYYIKKDKQNDLIQKANKKTAEYHANKPSSGVFTEVVTHGAFTNKLPPKEKQKTEFQVCPPKLSINGANGAKSLLGFPSSANDLALDAKSDLESDPNISKEVKEKVIEKLFSLVSMVQHVYESKVRLMSDYEKYKDSHKKTELRKEKEHSEQLYKLNMNFQNEVVQSIQRLKSELDISSNVTKEIEETIPNNEKESSVDFKVTEEHQDCKINVEVDDNVNKNVSSVDM